VKKLINHKKAPPGMAGLAINTTFISTRIKLLKDVFSERPKPVPNDTAKA
jgi:hypothetical protein